MNNVTLLFVAQAVGYLIPVFEIPVLARALGPESYGKLVLVQALALLASLCVEYGFGISAARQVALVSDNKSKISTIFGDVLSAKLMVSGVVALFVLPWLMLSEHAWLEPNLIAFGVLYFLAFGLSPVWLFQGLERLRLITLADVVLRCIGLLLLLGFVRDQGDYHLALTLLASVSVLNTLAGYCLCAKWVSGVSLTFSGGFEQVKAGFHVFVYKGAGNVLTNAGAPLVSLFSGLQVLGYYAPVEKVVRSFAGLATPILTGMFPYLSRLGMHNERSAVWSCLVTTGAFFIAGLLLALMVVVFGREGLALLLGGEFQGAAELLVIFIWIVPFRLANQAMGVAGLIVMGRQKLLARLTLISSVCAVVCSALLASKFAATGVIIGFIGAEVVLFIGLMAVFFKLWPQQSEVNNCSRC